MISSILLWTLNVRARFFGTFEYTIARMSKTTKFNESKTNIENIATKFKWLKIYKNGIAILLLIACVQGAS